MTVESEILAAYLGEIARVRATGAGTAETSYYGALQGAVNAIGGALPPRVYCLSQMSGGVAGYPDFGLFVEQQFGRAGPTNWSAGGPMPERGVVEADDIPAPLSVKRASLQVSNYLAAYGLVLITNFRDFELLEAAGPGSTATVALRQRSRATTGSDVPSDRLTSAISTRFRRCRGTRKRTRYIALRRPRWAGRGPLMWPV